MNSVNDRRRGFCPSVWTPMVSGDGLLVRVRAGSRALRSGPIRELAGLAGACGNGLIDVTRRANLQLRGIRDDSLQELRRELRRMGLVEDTAAGELRQSVRVDAWSVVDTDGGPVQRCGEALEGALRAADDITALPGKFGIAVGDSCSAFEADQADLFVRWVGETTASYEVAVATHAGWYRFERCKPLEVAVAAVLRVTRGLHAWNLVQARSGGESLVRSEVARGHGRMRDWLRECDPAALGARLAGRWSERTPRSAANEPRRGVLGFHPEHRYFELAFPFGTGDAAQWERVATLAEWCGAGELRVTSARSVIIHGVAAADSHALAHELCAAGLLVAQDDPLRHAIACTGAPGCASAWGDTRSLARNCASELRSLLAAGGVLHVSGCEKGCASRAEADVTLVRGPGGLHLGCGTSVVQTASLAPLSDDHVLLARLREFARAAPRAATRSRATLRARADTPSLDRAEVRSR